MKLFCPALLSGKYIPTRSARKGVRGGQNRSLPVEWGGIPEGTRSFALAIVDCHPVARHWVHWLVVDIPANTRELAEGASGRAELLPAGSRELRNSFGEFGYGGPQPPRGSGMHPYEMTVTALDVETLPLGLFASLDEYTGALVGHTLGSATVTGMFEQ